MNLSGGEIRMPAPKKLKIGELLVREGFLTQSQVEHALTVQKARQPPVPFGEICKELGFISPADLGRVLQKHYHRLPLGDLLVHMGLVTHEQIAAALEQQKKSKKKLGALLVEQNAVSEAALVQALYQQAQSLGQPGPSTPEEGEPPTRPAPSARTREGKFEVLVDARRIDADQLAQAQAEARQRQCPVENVLIEKYSVSKQEIGRALSAFYGCGFVPFDHTAAFEPSAARGINSNYLRSNCWIPLRATPTSVDVLIDDPHALHKTQDVKRLFPNKEIRYSVGLRDDILKFIASLASGALPPPPPSGSVSDILNELADAQTEPEKESPEASLAQVHDSGIVRLMNQIITDAYAAGVSDIHVEPYGEKKEMVIRFRVDGQCYEYLRVQPSHRRALVSRLKIMAHLDIAERRKPQDGKIKFRHGDRELELRVATIPTGGHGDEDVVLRVLAATEPLPLDQLYMTDRNRRELARVLEKPYGMILCVGPTGSGKTTTLHAALACLNTPTRKIWTAEDPVEISQYGLRQVQVHPKIGFDFAAAMRSFLRADPDVIMVGEIRDQETAEVAIRASLTGHLLLSTLHTNSAVETISRLLDMEMDPFSFADALLAVLAQRLARTLCSQCKAEYHPSRDEYDALAHAYGEDAFARLGVDYDDRFRLSRGEGCEACRHTGYRGRIALHELLVATEEIKSLILTRATVARLLQQASSQGMTTLVQDGILKCLQGLTDYKQVLAVAK
jgi:type II secretory ATPase GspE/PulE/Tfp pilus assembly ATPase PilB-like protein